VGDVVPVLLVVGGGLFGSQAAAYARSKGTEAVVFDPGLDGAASPAAAGLFHERWASRRMGCHFRFAVPLLDRLYGIRTVTLRNDDGGCMTALFVPPALILESDLVRQRVTAVGDGWLEAGGRRYDGWVYIAAGIWAGDFLPGLEVSGKAGAAFSFPGERQGRIRPVRPNGQAIAFVRDAGSTHFTDGTAVPDYTAEHDRQTLCRAAEMGLTAAPLRRFWGRRPYTPGGPLFRRLASRTWLATGGRKMGTVVGASFARRLVDDELR
jgi:glycine/D-amino acid oxidase-like deaminating enzyme